MIPRRRKRPTHWSVPAPSLLPKVKWIKKSSNNNKHKLKWILDDLKINQNDKKILIKIAKSVKSIKLSSNCAEISKIIAEYSFGIIKLCPKCNDNEILIIQSSFNNLEQGIKCLKCKTNIYIHTCDNCHDFNAYYNPGWWLADKSIKQTQPYPIPESNTCRDCVLTLILPQKIHGALDNITICPELCSGCKYKCIMCSLTFCLGTHLAFDCMECSSKYCSKCYDYIGECLNCYYYRQSNQMYDTNKYPKLEQRLLYFKYFVYLKKIFNLKNESTIIPAKILQFIDGYIYGDIWNCEHDECINDETNLSQLYLPRYSYDECINDILFSGSKHRVYNNNMGPVRQIAECDKHHLNYFHQCAKCHSQDHLDAISPLKYLLYSPSSQWYLNWTTPDERIQIQYSICHICFTENKMRTSILCLQCASWCPGCRMYICNDHIIECMACKSIRYCINCQTNFNTLITCSVCFDMICSDCWWGFINPGICWNCYSSSIHPYCTTNNQYQNSIRNMKFIYTMTSMPLTRDIVGLIAAYAVN